MSLGKRIRAARKLKKYSQKKLGLLTGLAQQTIQSIESDETENPRRLDKIAHVLDTTEEWLRFGEAIAPVTNLVYYQVPLLTREQMKSWLEKGSISNQEENMYTITAQSYVGKNARAFIVNTEAMRSQHPDSVMPGDIAIVDVDRPVINNCLVAVLIEQDISVRLYKQEEGRQFLVAYNPDYPTIPIDKKVKIIGPIIETHRQRYPQLTSENSGGG